MKTKTQKELVKKLKKWTQPDKELDKRIKAEKEGKRSFFQAAWHGKTLSNIPAVNMGIKIAIGIFVLWLTIEVFEWSIYVSHALSMISTILIILQSQIKRLTCL